MANLKSTTVSDTGFLQLPTGTTGERPQSPTAGEIRFNTDTKVCEWYDDQLAAWFPTGVVPPVATGGDTVEDVDIDGVIYRIHSFTTVGESTFTVTRGGSVDFLIVAGGGDASGGGGGGGGVIQGTQVVASQNYKVNVGNSFENSFLFSFLAFAGGFGSSYSTGSIGGDGGSGGGGAIASGADGTPGLGTPGQGNHGTRRVSSGGGAGGGGAGSLGEEGSSNIGGNGGAGISCNITGTLSFYAAGGAGGGSSNGGIGGLGGGGNGGSVGGENGVQNTGSGAGGGYDTRGGNGGSGIVIIRYRIS